MKVVAVLYPGGSAASDTPELLGCAENALGLREWLEGSGHELVALTDRESGLDSHLPTADVLIATPFWPAYISRERIESAPNLKLLLTAGSGPITLTWRRRPKEISPLQRLPEAMS